MTAARRLPPPAPHGPVTAAVPLPLGHVKRRRAPSEGKLLGMERTVPHGSKRTRDVVLESEDPYVLGVHRDGIKRRPVGEYRPLFQHELEQQARKPRPVVGKDSEVERVSTSLYGGVRPNTRKSYMQGQYSLTEGQSRARATARYNTSVFQTARRAAPISDAERASMQVVDLDADKGHPRERHRR